MGMIKNGVVGNVMAMQPSAPEASAPSSWIRGRFSDPLGTRKTGGRILERRLGGQLVGCHVELSEFALVQRRQGDAFDFVTHL